ncbi:RING finger protein [Legionella drancourtii]|uniref:Uncharacterized protein n=1 Tax=Legionella drancourtii LLAP12 TaxID=658187 RepID=G9EUF5_9GAMM|nr:hypothetical protein [Legionella drancourtii]EHL28955.1 hypothetical protein LDG_8949 [Legionella drancourtii LLAP12]
MLSQPHIQTLINKDKDKQSDNPIDGDVFERVIPVFAKQLPGSTEEDPLLAFIKLVKTKPDGYWLMRESRVEGMISTTFKLNGEVCHDRFVFKNQQWRVVNDEQKIPAVGAYEPLNKDTVNISVIDSLLAAIYATRPHLEYKKLIIPAAASASRNMSYLQESPYVLVTQRDGREQKIYADLLGSLTGITNLINENILILKNGSTHIALDMELLKSIELPSRNKLNEDLCLKKTFLLANSASFLKDLFTEWLETNRLGEDLFCPVGADLFVEPYYVVESGQVFDVSSLFHQGKCLLTCPVTRMPIMLHPVHFEGYRRKLSECLILFFDFIELYQEKLEQVKAAKNNITKNEGAVEVVNTTMVTKASGHLFFAEGKVCDEPACSSISLSSSNPW